MRKYEDLPSRACEAEAVGEISAHVVPESLQFFLWDDARVGVVAFHLRIVPADVLPVVARTAAATAAASTASTVKL